MLTQRIGLIGAGQMARALSRGMVAAGLTEGARIVAFDPVPAALEALRCEVAGVQLAGDNRGVVESSDVVLLAVKPQSVASVARSLSGAFSERQLLVSIVAGLSLARLAALFGTRRIVRVMPNTPCLVGEGAAGFARGPGAGDDDGRLVARMLEAVGLAVPLDEALLDAVTGLSGSGPAFVYLMIEAMSDGGVRMGLPRAVATRLASQTVLGAARMVLSGDEHPAVLKDRVASPAGTTIAGLQAMEEGGVRASLMAAVQRATERARELGESSVPAEPPAT
jgi:pyrroline-5-carboxylate reductase